MRSEAALLAGLVVIVVDLSSTSVGIANALANTVTTNRTSVVMCTPVHHRQIFLMMTASA